MLASKTLSDGTVENWVWDGIALIRRGSDIYVNEPHISGGVPILSKTKDGVRYHEHDFLGTTLWSMDTNGKVVKDYQDTTIFGEGSIQQDRSARFTGKPYDADLQAYIFPFRNYDASTARWRSSDPAGYPDGINQHFYACVPTYAVDFWGLAVEWYVAQRSAGSILGITFMHTWIQGVETNTNGSVNTTTYSGMTNAEGASSGSGGEGAYLNLINNYHADVNAGAIGTENSVRITLPDGVSGETAAQILQNYYDNFSQNTYTYGADAMFDTYNCNSVLTSMLQALGLSASEISAIFDTLPGYHWGWDTPIEQ